MQDEIVKWIELKLEIDGEIAFLVVSADMINYTHNREIPLSLEIKYSIDDAVEEAFRLCNYYQIPIDHIYGHGF